MNFIKKLFLTVGLLILPILSINAASLTAVLYDTSTKNLSQTNLNLIANSLVLGEFSIGKLNTSTITVTNQITIHTNLVVDRNLTAQSFENPTNSWAADTPFGLGTNAFFTSGAATLGITGVVNGPTTTERYGQLTILATGNITFTNLATIIRTSDFLSSRTITNGNTAVISVDVIPGQCTNMAIVQFK
jgi:hypothetical protein